MRYKIIIFDIDGTIAKHISSWRYIHQRLGLWDKLACLRPGQVIVVGDSAGDIPLKITSRSIKSN